MSRRLLVSLVAVVGAAMVLAELLVRPPSADERRHLMLILAAPAIVTAALTPLLSRWVSTRSSVAGTALLVGLCSLTLGAVTTSAASNAMFVSTHDYRLFLVVLVLSSGMALAVGSHLTRPLASDIAQVGRVAEQVANGDLTARTGVRRNDEVGQTAQAVDSLVASLGRAEEERNRAAAARQLLFSSIGHDLRTPLAAMRAAVESLQDQLAVDPPRYYGVLGTQLDHIEGLLEQLVEYARIESGHGQRERASVSVAELADESVEALCPVAHRAGVTLVVTTDGPALVMASASDLARVLRNLADNAIRHSPRGGAVTIDIRTGDTEVLVAVRDQGPGFPEQFAAQAFDPFTRSDPARDTRTGHAGLGLAIARALVEAHDGRIWIASWPDGDGGGAQPSGTSAPVRDCPGRAAGRVEGADVRFSLPRKAPA
ncbi:MAG: HAMP domain-containing histidine kinase [Acidimicrobiia bacterium]|nr:HAMP domain-containing histidine kinase [Acidimicrobiia bacterium]MDH4364346.1 HAMP domain-containing histidine kinase [Acidimicrobiia bacterium]